MACMSSEGSWIKTDISKKTKACPICGKQDYCFFRQHSVDGNYEYFCHRAKVQGDTIGTDGILYRFKRFSESAQAVVFETDADIELRRGSYRANTSDRPVIMQGPSNEPCKGDIEVAPVKERDSFNRSLARVMRLSAKHEASLKKEWNTPSTPDLFEKVTNKYPIITLPPNDYIVSRFGYQGDKSLPKRKEIAEKMAQTFGNIARFPGFCKNAKGELTIVGGEGLLFPTFDKDGNMTSYRLRLDFPDIKGQMPDGREGVFSYSYDKNGKPGVRFYPRVESGQSQPEEVAIAWPPKGKVQNKYKNLCSSFPKQDENGSRTNVYGEGSRLGSEPSLYTSETDNMSVVFITEGEKKAMVANVLSGYPVISIPGVKLFMKIFEKCDDGESMMDSLVRRGCKVAVICYDADKSHNQDVLMAQNGLAKALSESGIKIAIGEWDSNWGKGLDDIYVNGLKPTIYPVRV